MTDTKYLTDALADLGSRRRVFAAVICEHRDQCVEQGDHEMAAVWNAIAVTIHEGLDAERATLRAMEADLGPVVRPLTVEELAESRFDDETPQVPPC